MSRHVLVILASVLPYVCAGVCMPSSTSTDCLLESQGENEASDLTNLLQSQKKGSDQEVLEKTRGVFVDLKTPVTHSSLGGVPEMSVGEAILKYGSDGDVIYENVGIKITKYTADGMVLADYLFYQLLPALDRNYILQSTDNTAASYWLVPADYPVTTQEQACATMFPPGAETNTEPALISVCPMSR